MREVIRKRHEMTDEPRRDLGAPDVSPEGIRRRISEANADYVAEHEPMELPSVPRLALAVVTCIDCRLTGRLEEALGLRPGDAVVVRVAGNTIAGTDDVTRSLAVTVVEQGVQTIIVVGHTDCAMPGIEPLAFGERLSQRGVSRFALGALPLREWLGLFRDVAENVRETARKLSLAPALPRDIQVIGALFDIRSSALTWLDD